MKACIHSIILILLCSVTHSVDVIKNEMQHGMSMFFEIIMGLALLTVTAKLYRLFIQFPVYFHLIQSVLAKTKTGSFFSSWNTSVTKANLPLWAYAKSNPWLVSATEVKVMNWKGAVVHLELYLPWPMAQAYSLPQCI